MRTALQRVLVFVFYIVFVKQKQYLGVQGYALATTNKAGREHKCRAGFTLAVKCVIISSNEREEIQMTKILFICHGNICRSPLAEFIMKDIVSKNGLDNEFFIQSAATSTEELGNPVYPPVRRILNSLGIDCSKKRAVRVKPADYKEYDYLICMDKNNLRNLSYIIGSDTENKVSRLLDFTNTPHDVADPWYTGDFEITLKDVNDGCNALFKHIISL